MRRIVPVSFPAQHLHTYSPERYQGSWSSGQRPDQQAGGVLEYAQVSSLRVRRERARSGGNNRHRIQPKGVCGFGRFQL